ncbi:SpoIIE family protein phosphatase [Geobacter sp. DSM 9736]|uniref:SpoIIE family protein phosphatase n=1 Tax=Geobacter sp. DSM 9736 TaxID=1277350 RepID=UPI000B510255|nr:SpoIIE family protein phosphatase [Geobacter sp. DSM 9736]SNB46090.1 sigma-B regulation protein RsbU (phosphoserine phosphatase) [Geobacter sp. DSM 9736]
MKLGIELVVGVSLLYIFLLFLVAYYADRKRELGRSIISNPHIYSLSIAVYATSWTFYGSVGKAATTGLDYLLIYLGPSLAAFSWWFLLRKIVRISKENNITSIADFISSRYGKSQWLGALVTIIAILGIMPYIALQLKAVSTTFDIICGYPALQLEAHGAPAVTPHSDFFTALILAIFGVIFGARHLVSSERHEGLVAAIAVESVVKLATFLIVGFFVTFVMFDGFTDIFSRIQERGDLIVRLTTIGQNVDDSFVSWFTMLFLSMGAVMLLPRQFHIMVIENSDEEHIKEAMWLFPAYLFLINLFVMPIALGGIIYSGGSHGADYFVLNLPLNTGHRWLALLTFLGGFSAAAGMVMVESIAISTMLMNHLLMPIVVKLKPRAWFPLLLINLKRFGIFLVVFLGYLYHRIVGETYMLVNMGLISFAAAAQFGPALAGSLYWRRGNKAGAITGIFLGFLAWFYTLLIPSLISSGWWPSKILDHGPFGIELLRPTALFGLTGFDIWTHSLFWSMLFNIGGYLACSILLEQDDTEREQAKKFIDVFDPQKNGIAWETKRLSKPITIMQFVTLMSKFIGEAQAHAAIADYLGDREIDEKGSVSEFELPKLKRFIEKSLAASVGAAAAGAIVESYLSDLGSKMESVYDIFSTVRSSLAESREALYVRLRASEIMSRTTDLQTIMDDLLGLLLNEFKFDLAIIRLINKEGILTVQSYRGSEARSITESDWLPEIDTYIGEAFLSNKPQFINDTANITKPRSREIMEKEGIKSFAHIPIASEGSPPTGVLSVFSKTIIGFFTEPFIRLLGSLAGQLAQAVKIDSEMKAREQERQQKEKALLEKARVLRDMELAKQIQLSLLPASPPELQGMQLASTCVPATHVGGDYYDFFQRGTTVLDAVIADVSGHSVGAALIMVETRSVLRAQFRFTDSTSDILAVLNNLLYEDLTRAELFISMFYIKYDVSTHVLTYSSAGHNQPILFRHGQLACSELDAEGLILGIKKDVVFEEKTIRLQKGDVLVIYTDGITEAQNETGELFGSTRLCEIISKVHDQHPDVVINRILSEVTSFCSGHPLEDDISLVVMRIV